MKTDVEKPLWVPEAWADVEKRIRDHGKVSPYYHVYLPHRLLNYGELMSKAAPIFHWLKLHVNQRSREVWLGSDSMIVFSKSENAQRFRNWLDGEYLQKWSDFEGQLWPNQRAFLDTMKVEGCIGIQGVVHRPFISQSNPDYNPFHSMEMWFWVQENLKSRLWFWDDRFYFENGDDALMFKMVWC